MAKSKMATLIYTEDLNNRLVRYLNGPNRQMGCYSSLSLFDWWFGWLMAWKTTFNSFFRSWLEIHTFTGHLSSQQVKVCYSDICNSGPTVLPNPVFKKIQILNSRFLDPYRKGNFFNSIWYLILWNFQIPHSHQHCGFAFWKIHICKCGFSK